MLKIRGFGDAAPQAVLGIHGKGHVRFAIDHGQSRVIAADNFALGRIKKRLDFFILDIKAGLGADLPRNAVIAFGNADVGALKAAAFHVVVIVSEHHHIFFLPADYARVEDQGTGIGHIRPGQDGIMPIPGNTGAGFQNIAHLLFSSAYGFCVFCRLL